LGDVVSMGVIALHTLYLVMWFSGAGSAQDQMWVALAAYAAYVVNAIQFLLKFQQAKAGGREGLTTLMPDEFSAGVNS